MFFDDGGKASEMGWWITAEDSFGENLLWCAGNFLKELVSRMPGSMSQPPESGWQLRGYLGFYEVDLQVSCKEVKEPSLISVGQLPPGLCCSFGGTEVL